jgi:outer membrane lipoprotein-sorting protein
MTSMRSIVLGALLLPAAAIADGPLDTLVDEVRSARRGVRAVDATFEQEKTMPLFSETVRARGRLRMLGSDRLRWDVDPPDASSFVFDRGTVAFRGPDGHVEALGGTGLFGAVLGDLGAILGGDLRALETRYRLTASAGAGGAVTLVAIPREESLRRSVTEIRVEFARDRRVLKTLVLVEPSGDRATIRFTRFDTSANVSADAFRL